MKLTPYVAQVAPRGGYPASYASAAGFAGPAAALAEGANALSVAAVHVANVEAEKRRIQVRGDATETKAALMVELEQLQSTLQTTESDPDTYAKKYAEGVEVLKKTVPDRVKYPESVALLQPELALLFGRDQVQANAHANKLWKGATGAQLDRTVEMQRTTAQGIPINDHERWQEQYRESVRTINDATWLSAEQRQKKLAETRKNFLEDRAEQHARQDPAGFLAAEQRGDFRGIDNTRIDSLVGRSTTRLESDRKEEQRRADKEQAAMEKAATEARERTTADLLVQAHGKTLDRHQLDEAVRLRLIDSHQYQRISDVMAKPPDEAPSDAATLRRVIADVHSMRPTMSEGQLNGLRDRGLLNTKDWMSALDRRRETVEANRREAEGRQREGESTAMRRHAQAEQELRATLGIPTLFDKLEPAKEKAWSEGLSELRRRSNAYGGKEDPLAVLDDVSTRARRLLGSEAQLNAEQITKLLPFPVLPGLDGARQAAQDLEARRATLPPPVYEQQRRLILELSGARQREEQAKQKREQPAQPGTPAGARRQ